MVMGMVVGVVKWKRGRINGKKFGQDDKLIAVMEEERNRHEVEKECVMLDERRIDMEEFRDRRNDESKEKRFALERKNGVGKAQVSHA